MSAGSQPATYVLSAAQPTSEAIQLQVAPTAVSTSGKVGTRPAAAPVFARLLGPGSGIRLAGILPSDVAAVQQQLANTAPTVTNAAGVSAEKTVPSTSWWR